MPPIVIVRICYKNGSQTTHELGEGTYVLGRSSSCDLVPGSMGVSRNHAQLCVKPDGLVIADLGSTFGTLVNSNRINRPTTVVAPVEILLHDVSVQIAPAAAAPPMAKRPPGRTAPFL